MRKSRKRLAKDRIHPPKLRDPNWPEDAIRYVAFLDVMGMKDLIARRAHHDIKQLLLQMSLMKNVLELEATSSHDKKLNHRQNRIRSAIFSDSLLFITQDDSVSDFLMLAKILKIFQEAAIHRGAPTKGAVSRGLLTANFDSSIFFGQPLVDAYQLQSELFYFGIILDNHVEARIVDFLTIPNNAAIINERVTRIKTPLKSGVVSHYNIRLTQLAPCHFTTMYQNVSGSIRKYVDNTEDVYSAMNPSKTAKE